MQITKEELSKLVTEAVARKIDALKEGILKEDAGTNVPSAKAVVAFTKKSDDLIIDMIEKVRALSDEGEALIDSNLLNHPEVGTRNELLITRVGTLRTLANSLSTWFERARRMEP